MSESFDQELTNYEDKPGGPSAEAPEFSVSGTRTSALRLCLTFGAVFGLIGLCIVGLKLYTPYQREAADRTQSTNRLRQIGVAIRSYAESHGELPKNTYSPEGKPLLSWRVHLLPYLEYDNWYRQFKFNEPWDSPNNIRLLPAMPPVYAGPGGQAYAGNGLTHYRGFSSAGAIFERRPGDDLLGPDLSGPRFDFNAIKDGPANTISVVEAWEPVEWTKPDDLDASAGRPFPRMGGFQWGKFFPALMADGGVRAIPLDTPEDKLRALVTHSGGELVTPD